MADEISKTADWAPGTLDRTRKNIGEISNKDASEMAKKLGGQVMYESSTGSSNPNKGGRIVRKTSSSSSSNSPSQRQNNPSQKKYIREDLPNISKRVEALIDKLMISPEYKIKPNYGVFNFIRSLSKNGTEKVQQEFYEFTIKQMIEHIESFTTVIKTLIQIAPSTYKSKIANGTETKFKFLRMVAGWTVQNIKMEYYNLQNAPQPLVVADFIPLTKAIYKQLIAVYYYGTNKIPKVIKEIYTDESAYPDSPQERLSAFAKQAITEWLYIDTEIIKKMYPLLMRYCSDTFELYPVFFNSKVGDILKFVGLHKFDLLLPEKPKEPSPEEKKPKVQPPQKGLKDSTVLTGIKLLSQLFPEAGFNRLDENPDLFPYFQPLYKFQDGFNLLSTENPIQKIIVLCKILEDCFQGCRNIEFIIPENEKKDSDTIYQVMDEWAAYREESFEHLYCVPLVELVNSVYSQNDFEKSHIGKRTITNLLWQVTYHFLPSFKFDRLILEHPVNESKYKPLFHRTDFVRKFLTLVINECDANVQTRGKCNLIKNPWEHYRFDIQNEVSKRLDVLLGAQNKTATTNATNANLLKYTLCFMAVLDWYINNPGSPAYAVDPMHIWRISESDGKPQFSVPERRDQNKLFAEAIRANYKKDAK